MAKNKTVKCRYKYCLHDTTEMNKEDAVLVGKAYYHEDCLRESENKKKVVELFHDHVNTNVVYAQLQAVIHNIIHTKKVDSEFLVFALQYYINHRIPLNYPQGLYYVVQNKDAKAAWEKLKVKEQKQEFVFDMDSAEETSFTYKPIKTKGFGDILGG